MPSEECAHLIKWRRRPKVQSKGIEYELEEGYAEGIAVDSEVEPWFVQGALHDTKSNSSEGPRTQQLRIAPGALLVNTQV